MKPEHMKQLIEELLSGLTVENLSVEAQLGPGSYYAPAYSSTNKRQFKIVIEGSKDR